MRFVQHLRQPVISACSLLLSCLIFAGLAAAAPRAFAQPSDGASAEPPRTRAERRASGRYFVEFRARYAMSYGHTYLVHGRLDPNGRIVESRVAGLGPATESPVPWLIGHIIPVPSETGPGDGDGDETYVSARYRVLLSEAEYARVSAFIRNLQANSPTWHAVAYNCNAFVGDVAQSMGLKVPSSTLLLPADYINTMRQLNARR
jgi:hypothetical protein